MARFREHQGRHSCHSVISEFSHTKAQMDFLPAHAMIKNRPIGAVNRLILYTNCQSIGFWSNDKIHQFFLDEAAFFSHPLEFGDTSSSEFSEYIYDLDLVDAKIFEFDGKAVTLDYDLNSLVFSSAHKRIVIDVEDDEFVTFNFSHL